MEETMNSIKSVCIAVIGLSVLENLTASVRLKNQMKFLLSLAFLILLTAPVAKGVKEFDFSAAEDFFTTKNYAVSSELYENTLENQVSNNLKEVIGSCFSSAGISYSKLEFEINISQTNCIDINKVIINTEQYDEAQEILKENFGEEIEIINEAE